MRKAGRIFLLLAGMGIVLGTAMLAEAEERRMSRGTIQFQSSVGSVLMMVEDVGLLQDKICGIPEEVFDPGYYSEVGVQ